MRVEQTPWTDREIALLRALWADGWTASAIAVELGPKRSRNSVLSKIHRLGLEKRGSPVPAPAPAPEPEPEPLLPAHERDARTPAPRSVRAPSVREPVQAPPETITHRDPCPRCGAHGARGCEHRAPGDPAARLTSRA